MTSEETVPYTSEVDRLIPVGTVLPGVIISGEYAGDRADERAAARWASGHWALEVARRLETKSEFDVPFMWFRLYYPGMDPELALETIRLFGQQVIPLCR